MQRALSVREFAELNGISKATVHRLITDRKLESYMIGGQRRIRADVAESIQRPDDDLDAQIKAIVDRAPELTAAQRDRLAPLLAIDESPKPKRGSRSRGDGTV